jgi:hypothetical protein
VVPESRLKLIETATAPGFGEIDPDKVKGTPTVAELVDGVKEMLVT